MHRVKMRSEVETTCLSLASCATPHHPYSSPSFVPFPLHSNSHQNIWNLLELNPMTKVDVIYIPILSTVDGVE